MNDFWRFAGALNSLVPARGFKLAVALNSLVSARGFKLAYGFNVIKGDSF